MSLLNFINSRPSSHANHQRNKRPISRFFDIMKNMAKLYIMCGYPFSGKSSIAQLLVNKLGAVRVALDDINTERGIGVDVNLPITENEWLESYTICNNRMLDNLKAGKSVIADTVAYKRATRQALRALAKEANTNSTILYVDTPVEVVRKRWEQNRLHKTRLDVSDENFSEVIKNFEIPIEVEKAIKITQNINQKKILQLVA